MSVVLTDQRATLVSYQLNTIGDYMPYPGAIPRGNFVKITVLNRGKRARAFTIFGKTTKTIKPGGQAHLFKHLLARGAFPYATSPGAGKRFRGRVFVT
jgi:hypothetical protein